MYVYKDTSIPVSLSPVLPGEAQRQSLVRKCMCIDDANMGSTSNRLFLCIPRKNSV